MKPLVEISLDDGTIHDLRTVELLRQNNLKATFFIPNCCELKPSDICNIAQDMDIGGHTVTHPQDLKMLYDEDIYHEVVANKHWLEDIIGRPVTKFCYPRGRYDLRVIEHVRSAGFESARTTMVGCTTIPDEKYRWHTSAQIFPRKEYEHEDWASYASRMLAKAIGSERGYFHLWFHSLDLFRHQNWREVDQFFKLLNENLHPAN